jgi:hypothetical protein
VSADQQSGTNGFSLLSLAGCARAEDLKTDQRQETEDVMRDSRRRDDQDSSSSRCINKAVVPAEILTNFACSDA